MSQKILVGSIPVILVLMVVCFFLLPRTERCMEDYVDELTPEEIHRVEIPFEGRLELPKSTDFLVVDNSAARDLESIALFMRGRAAGLHWLAGSHFEKSTRRHPLPDVKMKLNLSIDSMGVFSVSIVSSNANDKSMENALLDHIKKYWRYRRSASGKTELIVPFTWTSKY